MVGKHCDNNNYYASHAYLNVLDEIADLSSKDAAYALLWALKNNSVDVSAKVITKAALELACCFDEAIPFALECIYSSDEEEKAEIINTTYRFLDTYCPNDNRGFIFRNC